MPSSWAICSTSFCSLPSRYGSSAMKQSPSSSISDKEAVLCSLTQSTTMSFRYAVSYISAKNRQYYPFFFLLFSGLYKGGVAFYVLKGFVVHPAAEQGELNIFIGYLRLLAGFFLRWCCQEFSNRDMKVICNTLGSFSLNA